MALQIIQQPAYKTFAAGQQLIWIIGEDTNLVGTNTNVKFVATISVSKNRPGTNIVATVAFKSTPNAAGVGVFDLGPVIQNYVTPDYNGSLSSAPPAASEFQTITYADNSEYHALHMIDKFAMTENAVRYIKIIFHIEFLGGDGSNLVATNGMQLTTPAYLCFNGVVYDTDILKYSSLISPNYGYDYGTNNYVANSSSGKFLSDMPSVLYARINDYGTASFFNGLNVNHDSFDSFVSTLDSFNTLNALVFKLYTSAGAQIGSDITLYNRQGSGGWNGNGGDWTQVDTNNVRLLYAGIYPANLRGWSTAFQTAVTGGTLAYYTVHGTNNSATINTQTYRINIISDCQYEPIRLAWLNKYGVWDYYTFMKKSVRTLNTTRTNYQKLRGTWNTKNFNVNRATGGMRNYQVKSIEKIRINTDYILETEAVWLEQLMTSSNVFIVKDYFLSTGVNIVNAFVEPVHVTDSSFIKKTVANDKLIQYTFNIDKSLDIRTQRP
jgi:hypothetical protein